MARQTAKKSRSASAAKTSKKAANKVPAAKGKVKKKAGKKAAKKATKAAPKAAKKLGKKAAKPVAKPVTKPATKKAPAAKPAKKATAPKAAAAKAKPAKKAPAAKPAKASARDKGLTVDGYIGGLSGWKADVVKKLRALMQSASPGSKESIKWGQPVYEVNGPFAYIKAYSNTVNFGFWRGAELDDPQGLLEGSGGKMRHVTFAEGAGAPEDALVSLIQQAVVLNLAKGDPTRGKDEAPEA